MAGSKTHVQHSLSFCCFRETNQGTPLLGFFWGERALDLERHTLGSGSCRQSTQRTRGEIGPGFGPFHGSTQATRERHGNTPKIDACPKQVQNRSRPVPDPFPTRFRPVPDPFPTRFRPVPQNGVFSGPVSDPCRNTFVLGTHFRPVPDPFPTPFRPEQGKGRFFPEPTCFTDRCFLLTLSACTPILVYGTGVVGVVLP